MTSTSSKTEVMKVDRRGRVHVPRARREELLDEFERSGTSAPEFARLVGIKYGTFAGWRAQRLRQGPPLPAAPTVQGAAPSVPPRAVPLFAEVVAAPPPRASSGLALELPCGARLLVTEAVQLPWVAELLHLLGLAGGRPC